MSLWNWDLWIYATTLNMIGVLNLASELVENKSFVNQSTVKEIVIFMITSERCGKLLTSYPKMNVNCQNLQWYNFTSFVGCRFLSYKKTYGSKTTNHSPLAWPAAEFSMNYLFGLVWIFPAATLASCFSLTEHWHFNKLMSP